MNRILEILFTETWWTYDPRDLSAHSIFTHWFNLFEAVRAWCVFAALAPQVLKVLPQFDRSRSWGVPFVVFGLTDFREAYCLQSWLLWLKLIILVALFLKKAVDAEFYPEEQGLLSGRFEK